MSIFHDLWNWRRNARVIREDRAIAAKRWEDAYRAEGLKPNAGLVKLFEKRESTRLRQMG